MGHFEEWEYGLTQLNSVSNVSGNPRQLRIEMWGAHFTSIFSVFSVMAGWIEEMLFMLFFAYIAV